MLQVLPILDLQSGHVVRGVGGRRHEYRPIVSRLTASSTPIAVAEAFRRHFDLTDFYLADLDAIAGRPPALPIYEDLHRRGFHLSVDAGVRNAASLAPLVAAGIERIVVGLETVQGPDALAAICQETGVRMLFSLDLKGGVPLTSSAAWEEDDAWKIATRAVAVGVQRILVLDLARVGLGAGTGTDALCTRLVQTFPEVEVLAGGGVRGREDLLHLRDLGVSGVLVASALHDGTLTHADLAGL